MSRGIRKVPDNYIPLAQCYLKLKEGMEFKNYKELCLFLNQPIVRGNSLNSQKDSFACYFEYETKENSTSLVITNVYLEPLLDISNNTLSGLIQKLIVDMLTHEYLETGNKHMVISKRQLYLKLKLTNDNFNLYDKKERDNLIDNLNITLKDVVDFYNITDSKLSASLNRAFLNLRNRAIADTQPAKMLFMKNYSSMVATEKEREYIIQAERDTLREMEFEDIRSIIICNKWNEFNRKVLDLLQYDIPNLKNYYSAYHIVFSDGVVEESDNLERFLLTDANASKLLLNARAIESSRKSYDDRHEASIKLFEEFNSFLKVPVNKYEYEKVEHRANETYSTNGNKLIDHTMKTR